MDLTFPVTLEWWANGSTCLGGASAVIEVHERSEELRASGSLTAAALAEPNAVEGWNLLCALDPVFLMVFEDGSDFDVLVRPTREPGAFELTEYTGQAVPPVRIDGDCNLVF